MADKDLLERMDKSIARMWAKGYDASELIAKRDAVWDGAEYRIMDVTKHVIANVASYMPELNKDSKTGEVIKRKRRFNLQKNIIEWEREIECGLPNSRKKKRKLPPAPSLRGEETIRPDWENIK